MCRPHKLCLNGAFPCPKNIDATFIFNLIWGCLLKIHDGIFPVLNTPAYSYLWSEGHSGYKVNVMFMTPAYFSNHEMQNPSHMSLKVSAQTQWNMQQSVYFLLQGFRLSRSELIISLFCFVWFDLLSWTQPGGMPRLKTVVGHYVPEWWNVMCASSVSHDKSTPAAQ